MNSLFGIVFFVACFMSRSILAMNDSENLMIQSKLLTGGIQCIKDNPLSIEEITTFRNKMIPEGDNAKCFAACLFKKIGLMDNMGKISQMTAMENAKKIFHDEDHLKKVEEFINMCSKVNEQSVADGEKGCDRAKLAFSCFAKNAPKYGFNLNF